MAKKILLTGASGLVGTRLTEMLLQKGYQVSHLGRTTKKGAVLSYVWNVERNEIDSKAFEGVDAIVHLAGAGVADKRWNDERKKEILDSRVHSSALLYEQLKKSNHQVKTFVSASAIGLYGFADTTSVFSEESLPANDYLAQVVKRWEESVDQINTLGLRVVKLRIGIVLSEKGGALAEMSKPIRLGVGAPLGTGNQYLSWIHLDDLCRMFIHALENEKCVGAYNAVAPNWVTNREMTKAIAHVLKRPLLLPPVPAFVLKMIVGEMADIVLGGSKVSAKKMMDTGFQFQFLKLDDALQNLLKK